MLAGTSCCPTPTTCTPSPNNEPHRSYLQSQHTQGPLSHLTEAHSTETSHLCTIKFLQLGLRGCSHNVCSQSTDHTYSRSPRFHQAFLNPLRRELSLSLFCWLFFFSVEVFRSAKRAHKGLRPARTCTHRQPRRPPRARLSQRGEPAAPLPPLTLRMFS